MTKGALIHKNAQSWNKEIWGLLLDSDDIIRHVWAMLSVTYGLHKPIRAVVPASCQLSKKEKTEYGLIEFQFLAMVCFLVVQELSKQTKSQFSQRAEVECRAPVIYNGKSLEQTERSVPRRNAGAKLAD